MNRIQDIILKIPKSIYWISLSLLLIIDAISFNLSSLLEKIEIFDIAAAYATLISIFPRITQFAHDFKFMFLALTIIVIICLIYKPRLFLIRHTSFSPDIARVDSDFLKQYYICRKNINQADKIENSDSLKAAIKMQDDIIINLLKKRKSALLGYYGIAHTPLIFRLGFMVGDQNNIKLLHKCRTNDSIFKEWNYDTNNIIIRYDENNEEINSNELIVAISTSLKITLKDIEVFDWVNKHVCRFYSNFHDFDNITSYPDAKNARNTIMTIIRELEKKYNIQKIHLVISSSVAFTFFLAQSFSSQHEPITNIYHYQNNTYTWGICINARANSSLVLTDPAMINN